MYHTPVNLKGLLLIPVFLLGALTLQANEPPTVELMAGWNWFPSPYYGYPYGPGYYPNRWYPGVGFEQPLYGCRDDRLGHLCPYDPFWDCDYSVRYRLTSDDGLLDSPAQSRLYLPGSAPTELKTADRKTSWDQAIDAFLQRTPRSELSTTNVAPALTSQRK